MKVLIVTMGFFPGKKYGGPPVSINNFCSLMDNCECYIVALDHDFREKDKYDNIENGWNERDNCRVMYLSDSEYGKVAFERIISEINPDIIYLQSLFQSCVIPCLSIAKKRGIKVLLAPRGELCEGAFKKKYKKLPYIGLLRLMGYTNNMYFQSTSDEETLAIERYLGIPADHVFFLDNIPSIPKQEFLYPEKKAGEAKLIFLSRIHPKKNLLQAIKCLKNIRGSITFDIYGSLEDKAYWELCQNEIKELPGNVTVNYCGLVTHEDVHRTFSNYDAFLFPTFSENYGHVIVEALVTGCPVIISDKTPWNDLEIAGAGWVCQLEDIPAFEKAVQMIVDSTEHSYRRQAKEYAMNCLDVQKIKSDYSKAMNCIVGKG